jgi:hypothetical protein
LEDYPTPIIPEKLTFAKRLAQCLNPTLPHGTHKIALMVYSTLFRNLRTGENWLNALPIFCIGLFPFFQNCSIQVKPEFLKIIEENFLINTEILPMIVGLVTSILPGLEEKDEVIQRKIFDILNKLQLCVGEKFLIGAIWIAILRTPKVRATAIQYLMKVGKKKSANKENEPGMISEGDASTLNLTSTSELGAPSNNIVPERSNSDVGNRSDPPKKDLTKDGSSFSDSQVRLTGIYVPRPDCKIRLTSGI